MSYNQLINKLEAKNQLLNDYKLQNLNNKQKIISYNNRVTLYQRFLYLLANNDVQRLRQLINVCINHGNGINEIVTKFTLACNNLYKPKGS